ncbi:MAG: hypothetical protein L3J12_06655, partial [Spirochaetales bacterium]|nr:hypothetical protein [Spirochaetales bacterium]
METMKSKYNIFYNLEDSDESYIVNPLYGEADFLDSRRSAEYRKGKFTNPDEWLEKGYLIKSKEEEDRAYRDKYFKFIEERDESEVQIFWVPNYACNFGCSYCYQEKYAPSPSENTLEVQKAFFSYVKS